METVSELAGSVCQWQFTLQVKSAYHQLHSLVVYMCGGLVMVLANPGDAQLGSSSPDI